MNTATLEIRPELKVQLDHLAAESHRTEGDLANEAVGLYLAQQRRITARIHEGLEQAKRGISFRMRRWKRSSCATLSRRHEITLHAASKV